MTQRKLKIMSRNTIYGLVFIGLIAGGVTAYQLKGKSTSSLVRQNNSEPGISGTIYDSTASQNGEEISEERLFALSDLAFVGEVIEFGPSFWNQDDNASPSSVQEWESTPSINVLHRVKLKVINPIIGGVKAGQIVSVVRGGASPLRSTVSMGQSGTFYTESTEKQRLEVGNRGVFLLSTKVKMLWLSKSGRPAFWKTITGFVLGESYSYLPATKGNAYLYEGAPTKIDTIERKLRLYAPERGKYMSDIEAKYRTAERLYKFH